MSVAPGDGLRAWRGWLLPAYLLFLLGGDLASHAAAQTRGLILSPSPMHVDEGASASYTVKLATRPSGDVTVTLAARSGSGRAGNQYRGPPHFVLDTFSLTFTRSNWSMAQSVTVSIGEDNDQSENWQVVVNHSASGGGYGSVTAEQSVLIRDNDYGNRGTVTIKAVVREVTEGEPAPFLMHFDPEVKVKLPSAGVRLTWDGEFGRSTGQARQVAAGRETALFSISTIEDVVRRADGWVEASIQHLSVDGYRVGSPSSAKIVVKDNDGGTSDTRPTVSVSAGADVTEGGTATFTVTVAPAPTSPLTVNLFVGDVGAVVAAGDLGSKTVTVGTSGSATYSVGTVDDNVEEVAGTVELNLIPGEGYLGACAVETGMG